MLDPETKIWRYLDLARFLSLLTTRTLYFARPDRFRDPYELELPKSQIDALAELTQNVLNDILAVREQLIERGCPPASLDDAVEGFMSRAKSANREATLKFGVNCWHASDHESEAMWRTYSEAWRGVAVQSTAGQLRASLKENAGIHIDRVRYLDFHRDPIEKGHKYYGLFQKRSAFEHEKEVRATIPLPEGADGVAVYCDLDVLITSVHVSPLAEPFTGDAIEAVCAGTLKSLSKPVHRSKLYSAPDYEMNLKIPDEIG